MSMGEDLQAINEFFHRPENAPKTPAARAIFNEWLDWWDSNGSNWWFSQEEFDHARNLRNDYNRAQAVTPVEKKQAEQVIRGGMTSEQASGQTDRRDADGNFREPPPSATKSWWFWPAVGAAGALVVVNVAPKALRFWLTGKW